jgi:hypothetical protein
MPAARQRPGSKAKPKAAEEPAASKPARANPRQAKSIGNQDTQSRGKAETAAKQAEKQQETVSDGWPRTSDGRPMVRITMTASELIPTGQYANVSVGPCQIITYIDPDAPAPFTDVQRENMAAALNQLAEIVEGDVVSVQRNLVMESIQDQLAPNGG